MADIVLLNNIMQQKKCSVAYLARLLNKTPQTVYSRLNGKSEFTVSEMNVICGALQLTSEQREKIFYARG